MHTQDFTGLLKKLLLGQATQQETKALMALTESDEELAGLYQEICLASESKGEESETEKAWIRHRNRMEKRNLL